MADKVTLVCGHELPVMSAACAPDRSMPVSEGFVGSKRVTLLRDTGCSTVVVKESLLSEQQFSGLNRRCVLLNGAVLDLPVVQVTIDCPYYKGTVEGLCMKEPLYDVIIGNIEGARVPYDPDRGWKPPSLQVVSDVHYAKLRGEKKVEESSAVEARGQEAKKGKDLKPLKVVKPDDLSLEIGPADIEAAQKADPTLEKFRKLASEGEVVFPEKEMKPNLLT